MQQATSECGGKQSKAGFVLAGGEVRRRVADSKAGQVVNRDSGGGGQRRMRWPRNEIRL